ncbi:MAG: guanylate kinase [Cyanobacteria bacterium]|nr:guanylate kinase [Cyanobacteriota bacterium]
MKEANKSKELDTRADKAVLSPTCPAPAKGNLLVVTGPSGVGKGTVVGRVLSDIPGINKSVSVTTREKRVGEVEGLHYFFRDEDQFFQMRDSNEFLEWAEFAGHYYGTPRDWVLDQLKKSADVILEIEVQGARQVRDICPEAILIFMIPPSFEELELRLRTRATDSEEKLALRLRKAREEMTQRHFFDYEVLNDNLEEAIRNLEHIVYAERLRIRPNETVAPK